MLGRGPLNADALAHAVGARPVPLRRILRLLAAEGLLTEGADGVFGLTDLGEYLRSDVPDSQRGAILARGGLYFSAAAGLLEAVQQGDGPAFDHVHGDGLFDYLRKHPEWGAIFQASMAGRAAQEADAVVRAFDFGKFDRVVDVGGGLGVLLEAIVAATPSTHVTLFDLPAVIDRARLVWRSRRVFRSRRATSSRDPVPGGADAYVLSRVVHDWEDDRAVHILRTCRAAMPMSATLCLVEAILPDRAVDQPAAIRMDLHMLTLLPGRERTLAEYGDLLNAAELRLVRATPTTSAAGVAVIEAVPLTAIKIGAVVDQPHPQYPRPTATLSGASSPAQTRRC